MISVTFPCIAVVSLTLYIAGGFAAELSLTLLKDAAEEVYKAMHAYVPSQVL